MDASLSAVEFKSSTLTFVKTSSCDAFSSSSTLELLFKLFVGLTGVFRMFSVSTILSLFETPDSETTALPIVRRMSNIAATPASLNQIGNTFLSSSDCSSSRFIFCQTFELGLSSKSFSFS